MIYRNKASDVVSNQRQTSAARVDDEPEFPKVRQGTNLRGKSGSTLKAALGKMMPWYLRGRSLTRRSFTRIVLAKHQK
jgi:hypothetical protein